MVYTRERLEEALRVFRQSQLIDSRPSQQSLSYKRRLRRKTVQHDLPPKASDDISIWRSKEKECSDDEYSPCKPRKRNLDLAKKRKSRKRRSDAITNNEQVLEDEELPIEKADVSSSQEAISNIAVQVRENFNLQESSEPIMEPGDAEDKPILIESSPEPDKKLPKVIKILTHWSHPINFRHIPSVGESACHFCSDFRYGIGGLGPIEVELVRHAEDAGFKERSVGHHADGLPTTKMCFSCSMNRLLISDCRCHRMKAIPGDNGCVDSKTYINEICGITTNYSTSPPYPICSMCLAPASWKCCSSQTDNQYQGLQEISGSTGCGLLACIICKDFLVRNKGFLHLGRLKNYHKRAKSPLQFRADVEFLVPGSLLHQAYQTERLN